MIRVADRDGSGTVELKEFMNMMSDATEVSILIIKTCSVQYSGAGAVLFLLDLELFFFARS